MTDGGSAGTAGSGFRADEAAVPAPTARRLAWFNDAELLEEVRRRGLATASHNHTRWRNGEGPWSPCPATCPVVKP
jgi:hypothetical protein